MSFYMAILNKYMQLNGLKKYFRALTVVLSALILTGCGFGNAAPGDDGFTKEIFAMDTYMSLTAYGDMAEEAVRKAADKINELDRMLSTGNEKSEVSVLNSEGVSRFSEDAMNILEKSLEISNMTDGSFNPAIYPVMELWGFTSGSYRVPSEEDIKSALANINIDGIGVSGSEVTAADGMKLDFGGIAKGYASSAIMEIFSRCGVTSGIVSLGGNVQVLGTKPDGSLWRTAVRHPENDGYIGVVNVKDKAVITSGGYERFFEKNGTRYHHIIDPSTGAPAHSGLLSVSIVSADGALADGLSTALFIMGEDRAVSFWRKHSGLFDFIIMTDDGRILATEGIEDAFESEHDYEIVR